MCVCAGGVMWKDGRWVKRHAPKARGKVLFLAFNKVFKDTIGHLKPLFGQDREMKAYPGGAHPPPLHSYGVMAYALHFLPIFPSV